MLSFFPMMHRFYFFFLFVWLFPLHSLELKRVILSTNDDPRYIQFWPVVAPVWRAMGFEPTLALIADEKCVVDESLGEVIRMDPIAGIPESLQAQVVRLLLPSLFPDDGCLISDIDMIPISKEYFVQNAKICPADGFLVYRDGAPQADFPRYPMCYSAAKGQVFASVFGILDLWEIKEKIHEWSHLNLGWNTDEFVLYNCLSRWESLGGNVVRLGHDVGARIDRDFWPQDISSVNVENYIDCHCKRPYLENKEIIDSIVNAILKQL